MTEQDTVVQEAFEWVILWWLSFSVSEVCILQRREKQHTKEHSDFPSAPTPGHQLHFCLLDEKLVRLAQWSAVDV
jgi:hypothetical protein